MIYIIDFYSIPLHYYNVVFDTISIILIFNVISIKIFIPLHYKVISIKFILHYFMFLYNIITVNISITYLKTL